MFKQLQYSFNQWSTEVVHYFKTEVFDMRPQNYGIMATFMIALAFILLSGRRR